MKHHNFCGMWIIFFISNLEFLSQFFFRSGVCVQKAWLTLLPPAVFWLHYGPFYKKSKIALRVESVIQVVSGDSIFFCWILNRKCFNRANLRIITLCPMSSFNVSLKIYLKTKPTINQFRKGLQQGFHYRSIIAIGSWHLVW